MLAKFVRAAALAFFMLPFVSHQSFANEGAIKSATGKPVVEVAFVFDGYVREQAKKSPAKPADSFDRAVAETLRAQVKR